MGTDPAVERPRDAPSVTKSPATPAPTAAPNPTAAAALAGDLFDDARRLQTRGQARRSRRLARLAADPASMAFTLALTDQVGRIRDPERAVRRLTDLVAGDGIPAFLGPLDSAMLRGGVLAGRLAPRPVAALVRRRVRQEGSVVAVPSAEPRLARHLARRRRQGFGLNVNLLGEAILGDDDAARRLARVTDHIRRPDIDFVSVKASAVCAQISSLAFDRSVERVAQALAVLFRAARAARPPVFVNLDMEEFRDLELTLEAFRLTLNEPDLAGLDAGIVLQAYLPDSHHALEELAPWAVQRYGRSGGRTHVRIVKGANLAMERVEAELHGWVAAPYPTKLDVDASYKRLVARALEPRWGDALRVGLASHNLFDVAWGLVVASALGAENRLEVEMLEGMAPSQAEAVRRRGHGVRLYTPVVDFDEFDSAVAYLARRLDENSGADNYLRHLLAEGTDAFPAERLRFVEAVARQPAIETRSRRSQDRSSETLLFDVLSPFANQADTDWTQPTNREWVGGWLVRAERPSIVPCRVAGRDCGDAVTSSEDPSRPGTPLYRYRLADAAIVDEAVAVAGRAGWKQLATADRASLLARAGAELAARRGELIAAMVADAGKVVAEADVEVSEAIDYAAFYARQAVELDRRMAAHTPVGTVVIAPPWNFPLAIPIGGVLAALAAGNAVILKPAPETVLTAWLGARCLWDAGIPGDALQFLPCPDDDVGRRLVTHAGVDGVILTGSYETAVAFLDWRPDLRLLAETSGKNAVVVTAAADIDLAVSDVVRSAFGHAGQKCSAASLVIVERSVLAEGRFLRKLADATRTLVIGPASDPATDVGPLIGPPSGPLERALTRLEQGEGWLVTPRQVGDNPNLWAPGVRTGVLPDSWFHHAECFGPVLGIMAADSLDHALDLQNAVVYGLTAGLHSLDPGEIRHWLPRVQAGNAYVNRSITGAVVGRQPFGGWKRSSVGSTAKAGGPGYVPALCHWADTERDRLAVARLTYPSVWSRLRRGEDSAGLGCEMNVLRHLPVPDAVVRVEEDADPQDVELCLLAASTVGTAVRVSAGPWDGDVTGVVPHRPATRLRVLGSASAVLLRAAHAASVTVDVRPPVADGEVELPRWVREQTVSVTAHRYGRPLRRDNLGL
jgi:RHH-type transcriptional regulator, proline utilization regulon repressor / proline dehydrogenase / delta 1-pyrroline-5-carboxylate dehydrogenase